MTGLLALSVLSVCCLLAAWHYRKKARLLDSAVESLRFFAGRARDMQDLWYEETGDQFILVGADGSIHSMNPAARRLVGAPVEPVAGRPLSAFLKGDCEVLRAVESALADGKAVKRRVSRVRPVRSAEASREMTIRVVEVGGRREAWVLLGMGGD